MKRILAVVLLALSLCACAAEPEATVGAATQPMVARSGVQFAKEVVWHSTKTILTAPATFELWVQVPGGGAAESVLVSTAGNGDPFIELVVSSKGVPTVRWAAKDGTELFWEFKQVDLRGDDWKHLAVVRDGTKWLCYVNGTLAQTVNATLMPDTLPVRPYCIGGDHSLRNDRAFNGSVSSFALFSASRTHEEILQDMIEPAGEQLLCYYELGEGMDRAEDRGGMGGQMIRSTRWFAEKEPVSDYAYSMVVVGDTQIVAMKEPYRFPEIFEYIADHVQEKNIQFVIGVGDVTNDDTQNEWDAAMEGYYRLDGVVPYAAARGTGAHDSVAGFTAAFPMEKYADAISGAMGEDMRNVYYLFEVGQVKYMLLILDADPSDEAVAWASEVIAQNPDRNVILTTHVFLYRDGTPLGVDDLYPGGTNNGDDLWEKLVRKHENITLVLCGHDPCSQVVLSQLTGDHGNTVSCLLVDGQTVDNTDGVSGLIAILYFSEDGRQVQVEYYSPLKKQYFLTENQFAFSLDLVGP